MINSYFIGLTLEEILQEGYLGRYEGTAFTWEDWQHLQRLYSEELDNVESTLCELEIDKLNEELEDKDNIILELEEQIEQLEEEIFELKGQLKQPF